MRKPLVAALISVLASGASFAQVHDSWQANPTVPADAQPVGSVTLHGGTVAAGVGYVWGHGTLTYGDKHYDFDISGVSIADVGAAKIDASGDVYNLTDAKDFTGTYSTVTAGATVGVGGSAAYLSNSKGVVIKLVSKTEGLRFNLSANGVHVTLHQS